MLKKKEKNEKTKQDQPKHSLNTADILTNKEET